MRWHQTAAVSAVVENGRRRPSSISKSSGQWNTSRGSWPLRLVVLNQQEVTDRDNPMRLHGRPFMQSRVHLPGQSPDVAPLNPRRGKLRGSCSSLSSIHLEDYPPPPNSDCRLGQSDRGQHTPKHSEENLFRRCRTIAPVIGESLGPRGSRLRRTLCSRCIRSGKRKHSRPE